jgi:hypothetical protein
MLVIGTFVPAMPVTAHTPDFQTIYAFMGPPNDGANPGPIISDGNVLYGATSAGGPGPYGLGVVFSSTLPTSSGGSPSEQVPYNYQGSITERGTPTVVLGYGGALYGTAYLGPRNNGYVYALIPPTSASAVDRPNHMQRRSSGGHPRRP